MDQRLDHTLDSIDQGLRRHWVALTGAAVAVLMGGVVAKALSPRDLYRDPPATQLITGPPVVVADQSVPFWPNGRVPEHVVGTDLTKPMRETVPYPAVNAAYAMLEPKTRRRETPDLQQRKADVEDRSYSRYRREIEDAYPEVSLYRDRPYWGREAPEPPPYEPAYSAEDIPYREYYPAMAPG